MQTTRELLEKRYPMVSSFDAALLDDMVCQELLIKQISSRIEIPSEELIDFFYKAKIRMDLIERKENEYVSKNSTNLQKMQ